MGSGHEDSGRWGELLRLLCFYSEEEVGKVSYGLGSGSGWIYTFPQLALEVRSVLVDCIRGTHVFWKGSSSVGDVFRSTSLELTERTRRVCLEHISPSSNGEVTPTLTLVHEAGYGHRSSAYLSRKISL